MWVKQARSKDRYFCLDAECLGRKCFAPGKFQHRGATLSGSRNTGSYSLTCMNNAYHGCPSPLPEPTKELTEKRKAAKWKPA